MQWLYNIRSPPSFSSHKFSQAAGVQETSTSGALIVKFGAGIVNLFYWLYFSNQHFYAVYIMCMHYWLLWINNERIVTEKITITIITLHLLTFRLCTNTNTHTHTHMYTRTACRAATHLVKPISRVSNQIKIFLGMHSAVDWTKKQDNFTWFNALYVEVSGWMCSSLFVRSYSHQ